MKVQLVVVRGKPEGKVIPLTGSSFKIGRGETCHLRPNSEQVSREHAEFTIESGAVIVRDLGSRNGTLVNGKALMTEPYTLKDRDLVQVGPLTFAVSIQDAPVSKPAAAAPTAAAAAAPKAAPRSPDDVSNDDIDSWLLGDNAAQVAEQPTAVYGGDTITIAAFRDAQKPAAPANKPPSVADDSEYERQTEDEESEAAAELEEEEEQEDEEEREEEVQEEEEEEDEEAEDESAAEEEFMDPNNPFYAAKKAQKQQSQPKTGGATGGGAGAANATFKDSSDAANEILRKLMERRKASKS